MRRRGIIQESFWREDLGAGTYMLRRRQSSGDLRRDHTGGGNSRCTRGKEKVMMSPLLSYCDQSMVTQGSLVGKDVSKWPGQALGFTLGVPAPSTVGNIDSGEISI